MSHDKLYLDYYWSHDANIQVCFELRKKAYKKMQNKKQNHIAVLLFRSGETGIRNRMVKDLRLRNEVEQEPSLGENRCLKTKKQNP